MALKEYRLAVPNGETTVQLSEEDAERYGDRATLLPKSRKPANKAATPDNKVASVPPVSTADAKRAEAASQSFGTKQG